MNKHLLLNSKFRILFPLSRYEYNRIIMIFQEISTLTWTTFAPSTVLPSKLVMMEHFMTLLTLSSVPSPCLRYVKGQPEV